MAFWANYVLTGKLEEVMNAFEPAYQQPKIRFMRGMILFFYMLDWLSERKKAGYKKYKRRISFFQGFPK